MSPEDNEEEELELIMPFVNTHGDDYAYTAGYEMGLLDGILRGLPITHEVEMHPGNREQADLIAMRHGYRAIFADQQDYLFAQFILLKMEQTES